MALQDPNFVYPVTKKGDVVDDYHGTSVPDPYRWLEEMDSPDVKAWIKAQNELTFSLLKKIPSRKPIETRLTKLWNYERFGVPWQEGGLTFFTKNDGLQPQSVLYVLDSGKRTPRLLLDPNKLSKDGTIAAGGYSVSPDGRYLAYSIQSGGSDWQEWRVRDVKTGKDTSDKIEWSKFSDAAWSHDSKGFYYSRYDAPKPGEALAEANYYQKLYYHRLGTKQAADTMVYERKDEKEWGFGGQVTDDGRYLVISVWKGTNRENGIIVKDLRDRSLVFRELLMKFDASYTFVDNVGGTLYFQTDKDAPLGRIIAIDIAQPEPEHWKTVVPQAREALEEGGVSLVGDRFFAQYLKDAHSLVRIFDRSGKPTGTVKLPGLGSVGGFAGKRTDKVTYYSFTGFTTPATVYKLDVAKATSAVFRRPKVDFDPAKYESKQVFYPSKDGTRIPMFLTYRKGLKLDGKNPTLLYGYGGFNASMTPWFSVVTTVWMEMGGVFAVACLRGGGEYGKAWHDAGRLANKQNVFDDFIAAGEWLIANRYTETPKLAIQGGSNGGLLVGAAITQRPDLFGAALPAVGVMDMLRFNKFTIGWAWESDYGSPQDAAGFRTLYAYSPLHNIKAGNQYPPTLITTGDHDDRVVPAHSYKFAAAMQAAQKGNNPILIRIETRGGHGGGKPTRMIIEEVSDEFAFLVWALKMNLPPGFGKS